MAQGDISPWVPETNLITLAVIGKMGEELNETGARCFRIVCQGINSIDPDTGRSNRAELEREIADVKATIGVAQDVLLGPATEANKERTQTKAMGYLRWHDLIRAMPK